MNSKVIFKRKTKLEDTDIFIKIVEKEIDTYLTKGYKIIASNLTNDNFYAYVYVLLIKE